MKRRALPFVALAMAFLMMAMVLPFGNVSAITGNYQPDGSEHPYVGLVVADVLDMYGNPVPAWRGTCILLSPTIVLTAGHVTDGAVAARVWFEEGPIPSYTQGGEYPFGGATSYEGVPYTMPGFGYYLNGNGVGDFIYHDVGIVVLTEPVPTSVVSEYGQLPTEGLADELRVKTPVDLVGYGVQYQLSPKGMYGGPRGAWTGLRERFYAPANLLSGNFAWSDEFLRVSANAAQGKGGTAFGDSGGPVFLGGTDVVLAVTSYVANPNCAGESYFQRIDTQEALDWIDTFLSPS